MEKPEKATNKFEPITRKQDIKFNEAQGTLIIDIDRSSVDFSKLKKIAESRSLNEKDEIHLTIIGSDTAEEILASLEKLGSVEKQERFSKIRDLAHNTLYGFRFKPEFYYIKKDYDNPDPNHPDGGYDKSQKILRTTKRNYWFRT